MDTKMNSSDLYMTTLESLFSNSSLLTIAVIIMVVAIIFIIYILKESRKMRVIAKGMLSIWAAFWLLSTAYLIICKLFI